MSLEPSPAESARFGCRVGRLTIPASTETDPDSRELMLGFVADGALDEYDVVIVRVPADLRRAGAALATVRGFTLLPADHLCYWEWTPDRFRAEEMPDGLRLDTAPEAVELDRLVLDSFHAYGNHYEANPAFAGVSVVEGYTEWVRALRDRGAAVVVLRGDAGALGFGVLDLEPRRPDVRLAGMVTAAQGRGGYTHVLGGLMRCALDAGRDGLVISTQSDNTRVMRSWARLGLLPLHTLATHHLVRRELLD